MTRPVIIAYSAGPRIGLGHLRRSHALAEAMPGAEVRQVEGFAWVSTVPSNAIVVLDTLHHGNAQSTVDYVAVLHRIGAYVAVIDSMPPDHFPEAASGDSAPDWLITPYVAAERLRPPPRSGTWLRGEEYAILPAAFARARGAVRREEPERILVACGGVDPGGLSLKLVRSCVLGWSSVDVVVGPYFACELRRALADVAVRYPCLRLHEAPETLLPLYANARLVIGRPGLTRYEAAALGRPSIYLWEGTEYLDYFRAFSASGIGEVFLTADPLGEASFFARIEAVMSNAPATLPPFPNREALDAVDALGACRVSRVLSGC